MELYERDMAVWIPVWSFAARNVHSEVLAGLYVRKPSYTSPVHCILPWSERWQAHGGYHLCLLPPS
jgi:hypothetical protein